MSGLITALLFWWLGGVFSLIAVRVRRSQLMGEHPSLSGRAIYIVLFWPITVLMPALKP